MAPRGSQRGIVDRCSRLSSPCPVWLVAAAQPRSDLHSRDGAGGVGGIRLRQMEPSAHIVQLLFRARDRAPSFIKFRDGLMHHVVSELILPAFVGVTRVGCEL